MPFLLDTNTCIQVMRHHPRLVAHLSTVAPNECFVSAVTTYELFTGVAKCSNPLREQVKVQLLLDTVHEVPFDRTAAIEAGRLRGLLEAQGLMIGPYDILIAAQAVTNQMILVTCNEREFERVPALHLQNWERS